MGNSCKIWRTLKSVLPSKKECSIYPDNISPMDFNTYYTSVGTKLTEDLPTVSNVTLPNIENIKSNFSFTSISPLFVLKRLKMLSSSSSMDYLDFDSKLLNIGARYLAKSLSHLLNLSLRQSYIPQEWNMAFVTPIYKRKGKTDDLLQTNFNSPYYW